MSKQEQELKELPAQALELPGQESEMRPRPKSGAGTYHGCGKLPAAAT